MFKKMLTLLIVNIFILTGCTGSNDVTVSIDSDIDRFLNKSTEVSNENINADITEIEEDKDDKEEEEDVKEKQLAEAESTVKQGLVEYINKALGYKIQRPDNWYWRHWIREQIGDRHPEVNDYFITDPAPLPGLDADILGRIVIEVSGKKLEDLKKEVEEFREENVKVGGVDAHRYENANDKEVKIIEYHFIKDNNTYQIIYSQKNSTKSDIEVFETIIKSFSF